MGSSAWSCFSAPSGIGCYEEREQGAGRGSFRCRASRSAPTGTAPCSPFSGSPPPARAPEAQPHTEPARAVTKLPVILAITGASGAVYGVRLLEVLATHHVPTWLMISSPGWPVLAEECGIKDDRELKSATGGQWASVGVLDENNSGGAPSRGS